VQYVIYLYDLVFNLNLNVPSPLYRDLYSVDYNNIVFIFLIADERVSLIYYIRYGRAI
jgi:hypothetical protein